MTSPEPFDSDLAAAVLTGDGAMLIADLEDRAAKGCSISARRLVNARETLADLALSGEPVQPSAALTARIWSLQANDAGEPARAPAGAVPLGATADGAKAGDPASADGRDVDPRSRVPDSSERLAELHTSSEEDTGRIAEVKLLGAHLWRDDDGLDVLLSELNGLLRYDVWVIAVLVGATVYHRAVRGFPPEMGDMRTTDRRSTFCTHCVSANRPLQVENAANDPFFRGNRLVWQMGARAYAGVPVHTSKGFPIGTLCGVHASSRVIPQSHLDILTHYGQRVTAEFERNRTPALLDAVISGVRPTAARPDAAPRGDGPEDASGGHITTHDWFVQLLELELARARESAEVDRDGAERERAETSASPNRHWSSLQVIEAAAFDLSSEAGSSAVVGRLKSGELAILRSYAEASAVPASERLVDASLPTAAAWIAAAGSEG